MVKYRLGSFSIIPKRYSVDGMLIGPRNPLDKFNRELSDRTWRPQKHFFQFNVRSQRPSLEHNSRREAFDIEKKIINLAFDTPELISVLFRDLIVEGYPDIISSCERWVDEARHWVSECRYFRCLGMQQPFYDDTTLRAHCWAHKNTDVGNLQFSAAMKDAVMDMERARKRKDMGLEPNYIWDRWGPGGFIDGAMTDYLPRFKHNPFLDPDGVDVTEADVEPYVTHEQLRERYKDFIEPETAPFENLFLAPSHSNITLADLHPRAVELYKTLHGMQTVQTPQETDGAAASTVAQTGGGGGGDIAVEPQKMRTLCYVSAMPTRFPQLSEASSWSDVEESVKEVRTEENDMKIDAARMMFNSGHKDQTRRFYEEKCGWQNFMTTPDRKITGAVLCFLDDLKKVVGDSEWGKPLCAALTDKEKRSVMGDDAFSVFRHIEDMALERRRKLWTTRFSGAPNDEKALDYVLQNLGRRTEPIYARDSNVVGEEFDRELEPIGRQVQRRILKSDLQAEKRPPMMRKKVADPFAGLHSQQVKDSRFGRNV